MASALRLAPAARWSVVALALAALCGQRASSHAPDGWRVLAYVCADGDIEWAFNRELTNDLPKAKGMSTRLLGLLDRRRAEEPVPRLPDDAEGALARFVEFDASSGALIDHGPLEQGASPADGNLGDPVSLGSLIRFGASNLGADERLALVLCGHGAGCDWVCKDSTNKNRTLGIEAIASPVQQALPTGRRLDVAILYACNMATIEAAHAFSAIADHYVASQETVPFDTQLADSGFQCSALSLFDTAQTVEDFFGTATTRGFARSYTDSPGQHVAGKSKTLSHTRTGSPEFRELVASVEALGTALGAGMKAASGAADVREAIRDATGSCWGFEPRYAGVHWRLVDLRELVLAIRKEVEGRTGTIPELTSAAIIKAVESVEKALPLATTAAADVSPNPWCGLSIHLPIAPQEAAIEAYDEACAIQPWVDMLRTYAEAPPRRPSRWRGKSLVAEATPPPYTWTVRKVGPTPPHEVWIALRDARGAVIATHVERVSSRGSRDLDVTFPKDVVWLESGGNRVLLPVVAARRAPPGGEVVWTLLGEVRSDRVDGWAPIAIDVTLPPTVPGASPAAPQLRRATVVTAGGALLDHDFATGDRLRRTRLTSVDGAGLWSMRSSDTPDDLGLWISGSGAAALCPVLAPPPRDTTPELLLVPEAGTASILRVLPDGRSDELVRADQPD